MWKIFDGKELANGVIFIKSKKDFNIVVDMAKSIGIKCKRKGIKADYWFWDTSEETDITRLVMKKFFDEMEEKNIGTIVVRTLKDICEDEIEREVFLETMIEAGIRIYLYAEGCFATIGYQLV